MSFEKLWGAEKVQRYSIAVQDGTEGCTEGSQTNIETLAWRDKEVAKARMRGSKQGIIERQHFIKG